MPILRIEHAVPTFGLEFDTLEEAEGLLAKMRGVWSRDGQRVMRNPQARIVETVETIEF